MISVINESDFNVDHGLYAIKFWATWCQPCKLIDPTIKKLEKEFKDIKFLSIDIDQVPELAKKFEIRSIPTLLLIKDGKELNKIVGVCRLKSLRILFSKLVGEPKVSENDNLVAAI